MLSPGFLYAKLLQVGWNQVRYTSLGRALETLPERIYGGGRPYSQYVAPSGGPRWGGHRHSLPCRRVFTVTTTAATTLLCDHQKPASSAFSRKPGLQCQIETAEAGPSSWVVRFASMLAALSGHPAPTSEFLFAAYIPSTGSVTSKLSETLMPAETAGEGESES